MSVRPWRDIERRHSRQIMVGSVAVGGDAPVTVQTMTNTPTSDAKATIDQIRRCEEAGADLIRVSCPTADATAALKEIVRSASVPIVADIHFHYKRALEAADAGAACLRINPGNIGSAERVREVVNAAKANGCSIRIGVNGGSLERDLLDRRVGVRRQGVGHRLHCDRRSASDRHGPDHDLPRFAARDVAIGANAHGRAIYSRGRSLSSRRRCSSGRR